MPENIATILKVGATVFFSILIIGVVATFITLGVDSSKTGSTDFIAIQSEVKDQRYVFYDSTEVTGSQIVSAFRKFQTDGEAGKIGIRVKTKKGSDTWYYNSVSSDGNNVTATGKGIPSDVSDVTKSEYINPAGMFKAKVLKDANQVVRAIEFEQK